jgi:prepilin-type N-terminal cleavage/methylation domain-containing protein
MKKSNYILKHKKAFTLVEVLVVLVILGILFVTLMTSLDVSTDKAKKTGVQTMFQELHIACELTAHEKLGYNSFGWDTGDLNGNKIKDFVYVGDTNGNGMKDTGENFTGAIEYIETWTGCYTLKKPGSTSYDNASLLALQKAFNVNIDSKFKISISPDGTINMMSSDVKDPWGNFYTGKYMSANDGTDGGAFVFFSAGPDGQLGTQVTVQNGEATLEKINDKASEDDMILVAVYTYSNGKGKLVTKTYGLY